MWSNYDVVLGTLSTNFCSDSRTCCDPEVTRRLGDRNSCCTPEVFPPEVTRRGEVLKTVQDNPGRQAVHKSAPPHKSHTLVFCMVHASLFKKATLFHHTHTLLRPAVHCFLYPRAPDTLNNLSPLLPSSTHHLLQHKTHPLPVTATSIPFYCSTQTRAILTAPGFRTGRLLE